MHSSRVALLVLALSLLATPALAHVPSFPSDNTTPESAVDVPDAAKSWSFYDHLDPGEAAYYRFSLSPGERLRVSTFTPDRGAFTPSFVVLSPSLDGTEGVPSQVTVPDGMGALVVAGDRPATPSYEPFSPSANYQTANLDRPVESETTYLVAVYEPANRSGQAGVAVGYREEFSPAEYARVPVDLVGVRLWEGQHPAFVAGPFLATVLAGLALGQRRLRGRRPRSLRRVGAGVGGLLLLGSAAETVGQMALALSATGPTAGAVVTAVFAVVPLVAGAWAVRVALGTGPTTTLARAGLTVAAVLGVLTWAGYLVGPALLLAAAVAPMRVADRLLTR
ncbi:hypothetical protein ACFQGE_07125 [Halomicroarcula sp. GCM10025817]|uniref:hypothetical protein n=1 Tax=Haloarcula TaxID=2237 RepID=UPI0023E8D550|nr:hypothetical protein [Halomicroarcula sp. SYNS111]